MTRTSADGGGLSGSANLRFITLAAALSGLFWSGMGAAASLEGPVSGWEQDSEPSWVSMYEYVPDDLAPNPPILVVVHFCSGDAVGVFRQAEQGGMVAAADEYGFIMVFPQTTRTCWDVATAASLTHDGGGDTEAIVHQVQYAIATYGANADRVYITGTSSGAMVTQAMLAVYPDVFKAGAAFAGVPAGCWSVDNPDGQWSAPCAGGQVTHTAQEWGDMVRAMYPEYAGFRPRIQLWHGDADSVSSFTNHTEALAQWTNVLGLDSTPTTTTNETIGDGQYTREQWMDSCGITLLDSWVQSSGPHGTDANMNGAYTIPFFALDSTDPVDPQAASGCDASSGGMSSGGASSGGVGGAGGTPDEGGSSTTGGRETAGGVTGGSGGGRETAGGMTGASGSTAEAGGMAGTAATDDTEEGRGGSADAGTDSAGTANMDAAQSDEESVRRRGIPSAEATGCACNQRNAPGPANTLPLVTLLVAMLVRRGKPALRRLAS